MPRLGLVALLAGDLGSAATLPAAQALAASHRWDAVYAVQDAAQPSIGPQVHFCDCCSVLFCFNHITACFKSNAVRLAAPSIPHACSLHIR